MTSRIRTQVACIILLGTNAGCGANSAGEERTSSQGRSDLAALDAELAGMYRLMYERDGLPDDYPEYFDRRLQETLQDPAVFTYSFDSLQAEGIRLTESDDKRVRIFWWMHPWSGTFRHFPAVAQYLSSAGKYRVEDLDPDDEVEEYAAFAYYSLHHLVDSTYLAIVGGQIWTGGLFEVVLPMTFADTGISESNLEFRIGDSTFTSIWIDKNWYFKHMEEFGNTIPILSQYDPIDRKLTFPEIIDAETGELYVDVLGGERIQPSGDTIRLRFNGTYFEPVTGK